MERTSNFDERLWLTLKICKRVSVIDLLENLQSSWFIPSYMGYFALPYIFPDIAQNLLSDPPALPCSCKFVRREWSDSIFFFNYLSLDYFNWFLWKLTWNTHTRTHTILNPILLSKTKHIINYITWFSPYKWMSLHGWGNPIYAVACALSTFPRPCMLMNLEMSTTRTFVVEEMG